MARNSSSSIQNINNWKIWIRKNKFIIQFDKSATRYWQNLLIPKDPYKAKYHFLISKRKSTGLKNFNNSKAFIEHLNDIDDIYKNIGEYNPNKKRKILIAFDDMIADMLSK